MASINQIARERKAALRSLQSALKSVETSCAKTRRLISRYRARKNLIPEQTEFLRIVEGMKDIDSLATNAVNAAADVGRVFSV